MTARDGRAEGLAGVEEAVAAVLRGNGAVGGRYDTTRVPSRWVDMSAEQLAAAIAAALGPVLADVWDEGARAQAENIAREIWQDGEPLSNPYRAALAAPATEEGPR